MKTTKPQKREFASKSSRKQGVPCIKQKYTHNISLQVLIPMHAHTILEMQEIRDTQIVCPSFIHTSSAPSFPPSLFVSLPRSPTVCTDTQMGGTEEDFTTVGRKPHRWRTQGIERLLRWIFKGRDDLNYYYMYYLALKYIQFVVFDELDSTFRHSIHNVFVSSFRHAMWSFHAFCVGLCRKLFITAKKKTRRRRRMVATTKMSH